MKQKNRLKAEIYNSKILKDFNIPLTAIDWYNETKIICKTEICEQHSKFLELVFIELYIQQLQNALFICTYSIFTKKDHILTICQMPVKESKLGINNYYICRKTPNI